MSEHLIVVLPGVVQDADGLVDGRPVQPVGDLRDLAEVLVGCGPIRQGVGPDFDYYPCRYVAPPRGYILGRIGQETGDQLFIDRLKDPFQAAPRRGRHRPSRLLHEARRLLHLWGGRQVHAHRAERPLRARDQGELLPDGDSRLPGLDPPPLGQGGAEAPRTSRTGSR